MEGLELPPEITGELGTIPKSSKVKPESDKKRKNRRQRRRNQRSKTNDIDNNIESKVENSTEDLRVPEIPSIPDLDTFGLDEKDEEIIEQDETMKKELIRPTEETKKGHRRKRGGKRKKQRSPDLKSSDKENEMIKPLKDFVGDPEDDDDEEEDTEGGRKFLWRNVTKNGWIKKCILVEGLTDGGRPKSGDTVLVKSQGKLKDGTIIDDFPTLVFNVGEHEVIEGLDLAVQSMYKNELSILSVKPEMAYGTLGRKSDIPTMARITYLFGLLHFEKQKEISQLTWAQRRKSGQSRMRLANWWYQRKEYPVAVKCYKKALEYYNNIPTNQECSTPEEYKELLQLMEERLRVMRQVANIFKRIANMIQSGQISS